MHQGSVLKKILDKKGISITEFAKSLGISRQGLYGKFGEENFDDKFLASLKTNDIDLQSQAVVHTQGTPYLGELDIFAGKMDVAQADLSEYVTGHISIPGFKEANYFVNVRGSSMYGRYAPGDIIAIKEVKDKSEIQFGAVYVVITEENRVLKYVRKGSDEKHILLKSENPKFDDYEVERKKIRAMFLVLGKITKDVL